MKKDVLAVVFLLCIAAFGIACTIDVSESIIRMRGDLVGATGFPRVIGGLLAALSLICAAQTLFREKPEETDSVFTKKSWGLVAVSCGYILGISYLGFAISTLAYLFLTASIFTDFKRERMKGIIIYSMVVTSVAFVFFKTFKVYLPDTILF